MVDFSTYIKDIGFALGACQCAAYFDNREIPRGQKVPDVILFDLKCAKDHVFEAWFKDGDTFTVQSKTGGIVCPVCGGSDVIKAPMAPQLARRRADEGALSNLAPDPEAEHFAAAKQVIEALQHKVKENCDYVGENFAEEARKIYYGEIDKRGIYGQATDMEASELEDEGIEFHRLPRLPQSDA